MADDDLELFSLTIINFTSNIHYKVWQEITYPFPNFNDATIQCYRILQYAMEWANWMLV